MALSQGARNIASVWTDIQRAVRDPELRSTPGGITQYVWNAYQQSYLAQGLNPPPATIQDMGQLVSIASAQARAESSLQRSIDTYQRTGLDQALTADHFAPDINARELGSVPGGPDLRVRFAINLVSEGSAVTQWLTWDPGINQPQSVSGLLGGLEDAGRAAAEDYGNEYGGITGDISIATI